jgi:DUF1680 family protein
MLTLTNEKKYADVIERALYNGFLSSISLDGKSFFYTNPLEVIPSMHNRDVSVKFKSVNLPITRRQEVFDCSCCPPNIVRFIPSLANLLYTYEDDKIYVQQFMESESMLQVNGKNVKITQKTNYPYDGEVSIRADGADVKLYVRIPEFVNTCENENGYIPFNLSDGEEIKVSFDIKPCFVESNPLVLANAGKCAVVRGPLVYCMEEADNGAAIRDIRLDTTAEFVEGYNEKLRVPTLNISAFRRKPSKLLYSYSGYEEEMITATLIPYYAFANREECEMQVWHLKK